MNALDAQLPPAKPNPDRSVPESDPDLTRLDSILTDLHGAFGDAVITLLQRAQDIYGYLPRQVLRAISRKTRIPLSRLYGVATFYAQFRLKRRGRHLVRICDGTACHVRGAPKCLAAVSQALQVEPGQTSKDYRFTLEVVYCLGSCGLSPVALVDETVFGRLASGELVQRLAKFQ